MRDSANSDIRSLRAEIRELTQDQGLLAHVVEKIQDVAKKLERIKMTAAETTRKNSNLRKLVSQHRNQYLILKEKAISITSQTRSLQTRAKTLTYAEGEVEVRKVFEGLE